MAIFSYLSQREQDGEQVPHQEIQQALKRECKNASKLVALQNFKEQLLSIADWQLGSHVQYSSTDSESKAEKQEGTRPKTIRTSAEIANISQQHAALLRQAVFNTVLGTINVRREAGASTASITSSEEGEAGNLKDMVDQLPPVPDTPIVGSQKVWVHGTNMTGIHPNGGENVPPKIGMSYVEPEPVKLVEAPE